MRLLGVDVGGTFTDLVYVDTDTSATLTHKVPTTPDDPSQGVLAGIAELCERFDLDRGAVAHVYHGTTTATNAILEHDGARTGMITSEGYRDILHIGRHQRPQQYSIQQEIPWQDRPLIRRRHRLCVPERLVPPNGAVLTPLDEDAVRVAARALRDEGVESIAVCFLFSYINPTHEERARDIVREECPDVFVTTSSGVAPMFREFERFTTAAMNAFVGPKVQRYVRNLAQSLAGAGLSADLQIMGSNGGLATADTVAERPVLTLLSGPAAGVLGGAWTGGLSGRDKLITFDVGGTSADIGIVNEGRFAEATARDTWIAGFPVMVPMIDIHTIGAGGGSIAYRDRGGAFQVGPRSAGAVPGPAAYGRGGTQPTVTDANVVLGRLDAENFLGGEMPLDAGAAEAAIGELAGTLGMTVEEAAEGVLTILNSNMANAIRSRTVQKGIDPREFCLVAFGGAGPLHGAEVARLLHIPEVLVPPYPGINSAMGLLTTDMKYDAIRTEFQVQGAVDLDKLNADFAAIEADLRQRFANASVDADAVGYQRYADLRYVGQGYELRAELPGGTLDAASLDDLWAAFHRMHEAEYGHVFPDSPIELVNARLTGVAEMAKIKALDATPGTLNAARMKTGPCMFRVGDRLAAYETSFYRREGLPHEEVIAGPAIVLQKDSTTVVPPDCDFRVEANGNLLIRIGGEA